MGPRSILSMKISYIGRVQLKCSIECWRSVDVPLWTPSLAAADAWLRLKGCAYCGEPLEIVDPVAREALAQLEAEGRTGSAVGEGVSSSEG